MKLCGRLVAYITNGRTTSREEVLLEVYIPYNDDVVLTVTVVFTVV